MPSEEEIKSYYSGFSFETSIANYSKIKTSSIFGWMSSFGLPEQAKMLDVGGGGGFFAKAFEEFGFGESHYIDIDDKACQFAREELSLSNVFQMSVEEYMVATPDYKYDFIYCRHVIEHLRNPAEFIVSCSNLLSSGGVFIVQCPNALSKEGLLFPVRWKYFFHKVAISNGWSNLRAFIFSLTGRYGWGLDPIRHLWAVSEFAIPKLLENDERFTVSVSSASLADPVFSPYHPVGGRKARLRNRIVRMIFGKYLKGVHLVVTIRRK